VESPLKAGAADPVAGGRAEPSAVVAEHNDASQDSSVSVLSVSTAAQQVHPYDKDEESADRYEADLQADDSLNATSCRISAAKSLVDGNDNDGHPSEPQPAAADLNYPGVWKHRGNKDEDDAPKRGDNDVDDDVDDDGYGDGPEEEDLSVDEEGQAEVEENEVSVLLPNITNEPRKPVELGTMLMNSPIVDIVQRNERRRCVRPSRGGLE